MVETASPKIKKVLFYTGSSYGFGSWTIWQVYEIAQVYPTILLAEKLDSEIEGILKNKKFFPKLQRIIPVRYSSDSLKAMVKNNRTLYRRAIEVVKDYKPDVIVTGGLVYPFPLYLRRIGQREGVLNVCPFSPRFFTSEKIRSRVKLISAHLDRPRFLPFFISLFWTNLKKQLGHFLFYWILPLAVGERPFRKEPGCILFNEIAGRSADYYVSFLKQDYDSALQDGMPFEKLYNLSQPYPARYEEILDFLKKKFLLTKANKFKNKEKILTLMWENSEIGIKRKKSKLISKKELSEQRTKIIRLIIEKLQGWKIFIKPHPGTKHHEFSEMKKTLGLISSNIEIVDPLECAEKYILISDVIVGLPPTSSTLYTASLICPEKPILSLDFEDELLGDGYKNFNGVEYIDNEEKFINILELIRNNKYSKSNHKLKEEWPVGKDFSSFRELLEYLVKKGR